MGRGAYHVATKSFPDYSLANFNFYALLRIFFAIIILVRSWNGLSLLTADETFDLVGIIYVVEIVASLMLLLGLATQWVLAFFILFIWQIGERITASQTLGNDVAAIIGIFLILVQSGRNLSLDEVMIARNQSVRKFLIYKNGLTDPKTLSLIKFTCLFCYWLICCYSLAMHLDEPGWMTGVTAPQLLASTFMSTHYDLFTSAFEASEVFVIIAKAGMYVMICWYPVVLPFTIFGGIYRQFVVVWGLLFFTLSTFFLGLGSLGLFEFVFWAALFWPTSWGLKGSRSIRIYYDDKCNLCDKTLKFLSTVDLFSVLHPKPATEFRHELESYGITYQQAMEDLYAVDEKTGIVVSGYDMYHFLTRRVLLLSMLYPFLTLGYFNRIGPSVYRSIAKRRREIFGICRIPTAKTNYIQAVQLSEINTFEKSILVHIYTLGFLFFISIPIMVPVQNKIPQYLPYSVLKSPEFYGITPIDVFNKIDLEMSQNWFVVKNMQGDILPIINEDGSRGKIHKSDRIYFGHTLPLRRAVIGSNNCFFHEFKEKIIYLTKVGAKVDRLNDLEFMYVQYHQKLPDFEALRFENQFEKAPSFERCRIKFSIVD